MSSLLKKTAWRLGRVARQRTFSGGVHPDGCKDLAGDMAIEVLASPAEVRIALAQHIGAPCQSIVTPRAEVVPGDVVGQVDAFVSAPVHASIAGTVGRVATTALPNGRRASAVPIKAAAEQPLGGRDLFDDHFGGKWPLDTIASYKPEQITAASRKAGLVGLGGAAFPLHVKLARNPNRPIRWLLLNGCECEAYLTADYRVMVEAAEAIIAGALLAQRAADAEEVILCVEDNKPWAIEVLAKAAASTAVQVRSVRTKYPQGSEKHLILAVTGKRVPIGGLPLDVGAVVVNIATMTSLARAVMRGKPMTHRVVTVSGRGIRQPRNLLVPIGTSCRVLIDACGGLTDDAERVIAGGPMMGFTLPNIDVPVTKGTGGLTVLTRGEVDRAERTNCVRCGGCVDVCPMRLVPTRLALAGRQGSAEIAKRHHISACVECGCCAYACPSRLPLVQYIRIAKALKK